ncbi:hypothetical protein FSP39_006381 [Pinctada imbricata]|uniref:C2H2-type domain-containing protein n=1 Tax=Pinctada imbricata TaxID=66713 RepID=A0AA89BU69_PINIB|nr:hypothetical protein FSP39_006381 [Pinctada imbricata]
MNNTANLAPSLVKPIIRTRRDEVKPASRTKPRRGGISRDVGSCDVTHHRLLTAPPSVLGRISQEPERNASHVTQSQRHTQVPPHAHMNPPTRHPINDRGDQSRLSISHGDVRSGMVGLSTRTVNSTMVSPVPNVTITHMPYHGLAIPGSLLQYPASMYPNMSRMTPNELSQLALAQYQGAAPHSAFPADLSKAKAPFINRNYLELAMLVCNTFRGKLFPCPHCRYVTDRRNNLKRHISTMHQACDKVLECCGVTFTTKASLREHIMIFHHNGYSCAYCGRRFCRKALLKRHLSVHSGQKDYSCPHCDYATSHKSNLERHKRIHERLRSIDDGHSFIDVEEVDEQEAFGEVEHLPVRPCQSGPHFGTGIDFPINYSKSISAPHESDEEGETTNKTVSICPDDDNLN